MPCNGLLVIIGPSGSGKSSVARELHRRGAIEICPTWTTRPMRSDELDGCLDHRFVSDAQFDRLTAAGFFRVTGEHAGLPYRYGLPQLPRDRARPSAIILRAGHLARVLQPEDTALIYHFAAPSQTVARRLAARGDPPPETALRLAANHDEVRLGRRVSTRRFSTDRPLRLVADEVAATLFHDRNQPGGFA